MIRSYIFPGGEESTGWNMTWHVESWQFFSSFSQSYWRYYFHNHIYHNQILHLPWWRGEYWSLPCCTFRSKHSLREQVIILLIMKTVWSDFLFLRVFFWRLPLLQLLLNMYKFSNIITITIECQISAQQFQIWSECLGCRAFGSSEFKISPVRFTRIFRLSWNYFSCIIFWFKKGN